MKAVSFARSILHSFAAWFFLLANHLKISILIKSLRASDEIGSMSSTGTFAAGFPLLNTASCQVAKKSWSIASKCYADLHHLHIVETIHACIASQFFLLRNKETLWKGAFQCPWARHRSQDCLLPKGVSPAGPAPKLRRPCGSQDVMWQGKASEELGTCLSANQRSIAIILNMLSS